MQTENRINKNSLKDMILLNYKEALFINFIKYLWVTVKDDLTFDKLFKKLSNCQKIKMVGTVK